MHTHHSPDATDSVDRICQRAIAEGIGTISITDHCDMDLWESHGILYTLQQSIAETREAAERYKGRLEVLCGVELGEPLDAADQGECALSLTDFDIVICSVHSEPGIGDYYYLPETIEDPYALLERYYQSLLRHVRWGRFDTLAHMTYPMRYLTGRRGITIDERNFDDIRDEIFKALIEKGRALELNTSGLFDRYGVTLPDLRMLRRYRELGGELLTIGSDAHRAEHLCRGILQGRALAREAGFTHSVYYKERRPVWVEI